MSGRYVIDFGDFTLSEYADSPAGDSVLLLAAKRDYMSGIEQRAPSYFVAPLVHKFFMPRFVWAALVELAGSGERAKRIMMDHAWKIGDPRPEESSRALSEVITFLRSLQRAVQVRGI